MKKMMQTLTALLTALSCMPVTALAAELPAVWGTSTWEAFADETPINDRGMVNGDVYLHEGEELPVTVVKPRENYIRFVLRDDADKDAAQEAAAVIDSLFPDTVQHYQDSGRVMELCVTQLPDNAAELESALLLDLARRHLISEFYGYGETAEYSKGYFRELLAGYEATAFGTENGMPGVHIVQIDWDAVQAYLDAHYPGFQVEAYLYAYQEPDGTEYQTDETRYRIVPAAEMTDRSKAELAFELWEQFDIPAGLSVLLDEGGTAVRRNSLESPGDVTLDCELSLLDAVALNKNLLGVEKLPDTAVKNADVNGDGTPDSADSLAILRELVGLTEQFQAT